MFSLDITPISGMRLLEYIVVSQYKNPLLREGFYIDPEWNRTTINSLEGYCTIHCATRSSATLEYQFLGV